eukprot:3862203-Pyramimonas_sp.AAC.1
MRRLRLVAYRQVAVDFSHLDRPAPVVVASAKHSAACPQEDSHDIASARSSSMADDISHDFAVRDNVEEVFEETIGHDSSHDSRSGQDAVLGGPVGQTLKAQDVDHEASCYQGCSVDHEASDFNVESSSSRRWLAMRYPIQARLSPISRRRLNEGSHVIADGAVKLLARLNRRDSIVKTAADVKMSEVEKVNEDVENRGGGSSSNPGDTMALPAVSSDPAV